MNRPGGILDWLTDQPGDPGETVVLLDPDMILLRPISARLGPGVMAAESWPTFDGLLDPEAEPLRSILGRHCSPGRVQNCTPVGAPYLIRRGDLARFAARWAAATAAVRRDHPARWVAEMDGGMIAAAESGLEVRTDRLGRFLHETTEPASPVIHYYDGVVGLAQLGVIWSKKTWTTEMAPPEAELAAHPIGRAFLTLLGEWWHSRPRPLRG